jgi:hypothetical protein
VRWFRLVGYDYSPFSSLCTWKRVLMFSHLIAQSLAATFDGGLRLLGDDSGRGEEVEHQLVQAWAELAEARSDVAVA